MRRISSLLAAFGLLALAVAVPVTATATPVRATAESCDDAQAYPPAPNATIQINTTSPAVGETVKVSGIHFCPNEDVDITIANQYVGTGHTDAKGRFDPHVVVPAPAGEKQVCGIGASGLSSDRDCLMINVGAEGSTSQAGGGGSGTAMTGVEIALLGVLALALVLAGVVFSTLGRHRKAARV